AFGRLDWLATRSEELALVLAQFAPCFGSSDGCRAGGREGGGARSLFGLGGAAYWDLQLLAAHGYVVFNADDALRMGSPMRDTAETVLPGVDKVVAMGIADPKRLGVFGWSYGGYSTLSL